MTKEITDGGTHDNEPRDPRFCEFEVVFHCLVAKLIGKIMQRDRQSNAFSVLFLVWQECDDTHPSRSEMPKGHVSNYP